MDPIKEIENLTPEEQKAEAEIVASEVNEEDIRTRIATDLGISEDENPELFQKLLTREVDSRKALSKAIGQKIQYRNLVNGNGKQTDKTSKTDTKNLSTEEIEERARQTVIQELEQRDLNEMNHSDSIKEQIKRIAQIQNVSVRQAARDPYIQSLIESETRQAAVDNAAKNGKGTGKTGVVVDTSKPLDPTQYDLSTEEGRAEWAEAKKAYRNAAK